MVGGRRNDSSPPSSSLSFSSPSHATPTRTYRRNRLPLFRPAPPPILPPAFSLPCPFNTLIVHHLPILIALWNNTTDKHQSPPPTTLLPRLLYRQKNPQKSDTRSWPLRFFSSSRNGFQALVQYFCCWSPVFVGRGRGRERRRRDIGSFFFFFFGYILEVFGLIISYGE